MEVNKKAKVIMLPTSDKSNIFKQLEGNLSYYKEPIKHKWGTNQHLYFTTDDEIKEGDWAYNHLGNEIIQWVEEELSTTTKIYLKESLSKIIATTDKSLIETSKWDIIGSDKKQSVNTTLPQPSQAFIEKYCKVSGIDEVLVEFQSKCSKTGTECGDNINCQHMCDESVLKVDSHNTITIHPIKNSWSKEEVEQLRADAWNDGFSEGQNTCMGSLNNAKSSHWDYLLNNKL